MKGNQKSYQVQLEKYLLNQGYEIIEIAEGEEWWLDEYWIVQRPFPPNATFILAFIVDPMFEGKRKKGQAIREVKAAEALPTLWNDDSLQIASLNMEKGRFDAKLAEFIKAIT